MNERVIGRVEAVEIPLGRYGRFVFLAARREGQDGQAAPLGEIEVQDLAFIALTGVPETEVGAEYEITLRRI